MTTKMIIKNQLHEKIIAACGVFLLGIFGGISFMELTERNSQAAPVQGWKAGNIMSDFVMSNKNTMNVSQIQAFLKSKNSCNNRDRAAYEELTKTYKNRITWKWADGHFVCMADDKFDGETAAQIIYRAAQDYSINPQVLLVLLEKEQGLITDTFPNSQQYKTATGFGCPDTAVCDSKYFGLKNQVRQAAALFREVLDGGWSNYSVGKNKILYNPDARCGSSIVNIENRATSALYRYTPYQPNAGALAAGYGTAPCGAYGNRNFYLYFTDWFGDPRATKPVAKQTTTTSNSAPQSTDIATDNYFLISKLSNNLALDVYAASKNNGANIQSYTFNKTVAQQFKIAKSGDGYYTITNVNSNKNLDVKGAGVRNGTNVQAWARDNTCAQKWEIEKQSDEYYEIKSACSGLNLDVDGGSKKSGTNVQIYQDNNTPAQRWKLVKVSSQNTQKTTANSTKTPVKTDPIVGNFYLTTKLSSKKALDVNGASKKNGANIQIYNTNKTNAQKFKIAKTTDGYYTITNIFANKNVDVYSAGKVKATNVWIYNKNNTCAQKWRFQKQSDGYYEIKSACSGLNLDVDGGSTANKTNVQLWTDNNTPAQRWKLNKI